MFKTSSKNKFAIAAVLVVGCLLAVNRSMAGQKYSYSVSASSGYGSGSLGDARNSSNSVEYIGCSVYAAGNESMVSCFARDANYNQAYCNDYYTSPDALQAKLATIAAMKNDSHIYFIANSSGGCEYIGTFNYSYNAPKGP